jgi:hypothetical protein
MTEERGKAGVRFLVGGSGKNKTTTKTGNRYVPAVDVERKSRDFAGEGTIDLGKVSVTGGAIYNESKTSVSYPGNKVSLSNQMNNFIYKKLSAGLGYKLPNDLKISGFIDREKMTGKKGKNDKTIQLSGNFKGSNFVGSLTRLSDGETVGRFNLRIPFAHGGKVKPRGRKATY